MTNIGTSGTRNWGSAMRIFLALTVVSSGLLALSQQADARTHRGNGMTGIRAKDSDPGGTYKHYPKWAEFGFTGHER